MRDCQPTARRKAYDRKQNYTPNPAIKPVSRYAGEHHLQRHDHDARRPLVGFSRRRTVVGRDRHRACAQGASAGRQPDRCSSYNTPDSKDLRSYVRDFTDDEKNHSRSLLGLAIYRTAPNDVNGPNTNFADHC